MPQWDVTQTSIIPDITIDTVEQYIVHHCELNTWLNVVYLVRESELYNAVLI